MYVWGRSHSTSQLKGGVGLQKGPKKCDVHMVRHSLGGGWVFKKVQKSVTYHMNDPLININALRLLLVIY